MTETYQHPVHGAIIYTESFWTGKRTLTVDGVAATRLSKTEFMLGEKKVTLKGTHMTGVNLVIDGETIQIVAKPKWYEVVLAILPFVFLMVWGNSPKLCAIFPVIGGAIGGAFSAIVGLYALILMKKSKSLWVKLLIGLGAFVGTVLVAFALATVLLQALA